MLLGQGRETVPVFIFEHSEAYVLKLCLFLTVQIEFHIIRLLFFFIKFDGGSIISISICHPSSLSLAVYFRFLPRHTEDVLTWRLCLLTFLHKLTHVKLISMKLLIFLDIGIVSFKNLDVGLANIILRVFILTMNVSIVVASIFYVII